MPLDPEVRADLEARLAKTSAVSISSFLRYRSLSAASHRTFIDQSARLLEHVDAGELTVDDVGAFILDHYESNSKRTFVLDCLPADDQLGTLAALPQQVTVPTYRDLRLSATAPTLCYTSITPAEVRITWVEQHSRYRLNQRNGEVHTDRYPRVIVAEYQRQPQRLFVSFDAPFSHSHGETADSYYEYYLTRARALLGVGATPRSIESWVTGLEADAKVSWVKQRGRGARTTFSVTIDGPLDLRDEPEYRVLQSSIARRLGGDVRWLANQPTPRADLPPLVRALRTKIDCGASMITFEQHTLRNEMQYVLAHLP